MNQLSPSGDRGKVVVTYDEFSTLPNNGINYNLWDATKVQGCVCDPYYEGADCSLRMCPRGDNILTQKKSVDQVQKVCFVDATAATDPTGSVTLSYTDLFGGKWETRPVTISAADASASIQTALQSLPFSVIPSVTVASATSAAAALPVGFGPCYTITFSDKANTGAQNLLTVNYKGCNRSGCAPKYEGLSSTHHGITVTVADVTTFSATKTDYKDKEICSEHGFCDSKTGLCKCFRGYYTLDCSLQYIEE